MVVKASLEPKIYNTVRTGVGGHFLCSRFTANCAQGEKHFQLTLSTSSKVTEAFISQQDSKTDVCLHLHISVCVHGFMFMSTSAYVNGRVREHTAFFTFPVSAKRLAAILTAIKYCMIMYHMVQCVRMQTVAMLDGIQRQSSSIVKSLGQNDLILISRHLE